MVAALTSIGPAVFNGGISTLIAIIMLVSSQSHVFISYFKVGTYINQKVWVLKYFKRLKSWLISTHQTKYIIICMRTQDLVLF